MSKIIPTNKISKIHKHNEIYYDILIKIHNLISSLDFTPNIALLQLRNVISNCGFCSHIYPIESENINPLGKDASGFDYYYKCPFDSRLFKDVRTNYSRNCIVHCHIINNNINDKEKLIDMIEDTMMELKIFKLKILFGLKKKKTFKIISYKELKNNVEDEYYRKQR